MTVSSPFGPLPTLTLASLNNIPGLLCLSLKRTFNPLLCSIYTLPNHFYCFHCCLNCSMNTLFHRAAAQTVSSASPACLVDTGWALSPASQTQHGGNEAHLLMFCLTVHIMCQTLAASFSKTYKNYLHVLLVLPQKFLER